MRFLPRSLLVLKVELQRIGFQRDAGDGLGCVNHPGGEVVSYENATYQGAPGVFDGSHVGQQLGDGLRLGRARLQFYDDQIALVILGGDVDAASCYGLFAAAVGDNEPRLQLDDVGTQSAL